MRFGLAAVVCCQKHVVYVYDDHSDEMSRKVTQVEERRVQHERFPRVFLESVTKFFPHQPRRESGSPQNTSHNLNQ